MPSVSVNTAVPVKPFARRSLRHASCRSPRQQSNVISFHANGITGLITTKCSTKDGPYVEWRIVANNRNGLRPRRCSPSSEFGGRGGSGGSIPVRGSNILARKLLTAWEWKLVGAVNAGPTDGASDDGMSS
jgi:hypothetical protein